MPPQRDPVAPRQQPRNGQSADAIQSQTSVSVRTPRTVTNHSFALYEKV